MTNMTQMPVLPASGNVEHVGVELLPLTRHAFPLCPPRRLLECALVWWLQVATRANVRDVGGNSVLLIPASGRLHQCEDPGFDCAGKVIPSSDHAREIRRKVVLRNGTRRARHHCGHLAFRIGAQLFSAFVVRAIRLGIMSPLL